jgi:peptidyl-prolyl cis-trans isomerase C
MRRFAPVASLAAALLLALPRPVPAQPATPSSPPPAGATAPAAQPDPVVARVDGQEIRLSALEEAARALPEELRGAPAQMLYPLLLDQLIAQQALVNAARTQGLDRDPQVQARIRRAEEQELQQALIGRSIAGEVTEQAVRARFDRDQAGRSPEEELRARHILVATEAEARQVLAELSRPNADFAEIARRRSTSPDGRQGGDLGFFKRGDMVPEFAEAAFSLSAGQTSAQPVQSPFGWHVIRAEERRTAPPPAFDEVRDSLRQQMFEEAVNGVVERVRGAAKVERFNLDGSPQGSNQPRAPGLLDNAAPPPPASTQPRR